MFEDRPWTRYYDPGVRSILEYPDGGVQRLLDQAADRAPQQVATIFYGSRLTYGELRARADAFAAALRGLGVVPGDRVAIMLPNLPQTVVAFFGVLKAGAIVVMTNPLYVEREIEHQMNDSGAETMVAIDILYPRLARALPQTPVKRLILTSIAEALPFPKNLLYPIKARKDGLTPGIPKADGVYPWKALLAQHKGQSVPAQPVAAERDVAVLQYTGGTTGVSKGAMLSHRNLLANILQTAEWMQPGPPGSDTILSVMPFFHVYGLTVCMGLGVATCSAMVLVPKLDVNQLLQWTDQYKPTLFPGAPTIYVGMINHPEVAKYNLKSIRACISGSAALPVEVQNKFEELTGGKLVEGYGLTEASPVTHSNPLNGKRIVGSIGIPFPDTDIRIVDLETGEREVEVGQEGELCIWGPQVMLGYWNRPDETAATLRDGWLFTGDIARADADGFTYIVDRKKEMIIASGFNIYPREVEEVLYEHPAVQEAAAVGVPDAYRGETVKAFIVLKAGMSATPDEIIAFSRERMAKFKAPTQVEFRDSLPKTMIGKVLRRALREEELQKRQTTPA